MDTTRPSVRVCTCAQISHLQLVDGSVGTLIASNAAPRCEGSGERARAAREDSVRRCLAQMQIVGIVTGSDAAALRIAHSPWSLAQSAERDERSTVAPMPPARGQVRQSLRQRAEAVAYQFSVVAHLAARVAA